MAYTNFKKNYIQCSNLVEQYDLKDKDNKWVFCRGSAESKSVMMPKSTTIRSKYSIRRARRNNITKADRKSVV